MMLFIKFLNSDFDHEFMNNYIACTHEIATSVANSQSHALKRWDCNSLLLREVNNTDSLLLNIEIMKREEFKQLSSNGETKIKLLFISVHVKQV